jgi:hypothetical protein
MTYNYVGSGLATGFVVHLLLTTFVITIYSIALSASQTIIIYNLLLLHTVYSLSVVHYTH